MGGDNFLVHSVYCCFCFDGVLGQISYDLLFIILISRIANLEKHLFFVFLLIFFCCVLDRAIPGHKRGAQAAQACKTGAVRLRDSLAGNSYTLMICTICCCLEQRSWRLGVFQTAWFCLRTY